MRALSSLWAGVKAVTHFIGRIVTVVVLTVIYIVVTIPLGLLLQLIGKAPLHSGAHGDSTWRHREQKPSSLEEARRPF